MTVDEVLAELESLGSEQTKKTWLRHGAQEPVFGVKVGDMKKLQKRIKRDHDLALALYDSGNADAMYFAGFICDPKQMKKADLDRWVKKATWSMVGEYTVAWTASESPHGAAVARQWIDSPKANIAASGWATWSSLVAIKPDADLDLKEIEALLDRVAANVGRASGRVAYTMNGFVIAVGCFVAPLTDAAKRTATAMGPVQVDMGDTDCQVPPAAGYIAKMEAMGRVGKKRKTAFC